MELPQEAVGQLGSLAEEVLLQCREAVGMQRPQQSLPAEERVIGEQAAQGRVLGHHVGQWEKMVLDKNQCLSIEASLRLGSGRE